MVRISLSLREGAATCSYQYEVACGVDDWVFWLHRGFVMNLANKMGAL